MSDPIVFVSHSRIKEGTLEGFKRLVNDVTASIEAEKPRTLAWLGYLNDEGARLTILHVFADPAAFDLHLQGVEDRSNAAADYMEIERFEVFGRPSEQAMNGLRQEASDGGIELVVKPDFVGGFLRLPPT